MPRLIGKQQELWGETGRCGDAMPDHDVAADSWKAMPMSTVFLALALMVGLGIVTFALSLGLTGLGVLLSWFFPLTPFQGAVIHLILFALAILLLGLTFLVERVKDTLLATAGEDEVDLNEMVEFAEHDGRQAGPNTSLPVRHTEAKIGRNDPCPCGSGRKYKFCCLARS
jgi:hypothetical protein